MSKKDNKMHQKAVFKHFQTDSLNLYHQKTENRKDNDHKIFVRHLLDVKNTKFLYTKKIYELLDHHLVKGFDFAKFREVDYYVQ